MHSHCINKLLDLEDVIIKRIIHADSFVEIYLETKSSPQVCPVCGLTTTRIHDYRNQRIKDLPFQQKHCFLVLRKRRYRCSCGKRFFEKYDFLPRYFQRTSRLTKYVASELHEIQTLKSISARSNLSTATVGRILDSISCMRRPFADAVSIDEFKGNANGEKYQCILADPIRHQILDILPDRKFSHLQKYFLSIPKKERHRVKYFSCDMWVPYMDLARAYFPNAEIVIDRYHFVRQVSWAIDSVRKRLQKTMKPSLRKYYKRSKSLILSHYDTLSGEKKRQCDLMLLYNDDLRLAHILKEDFYKICSMSKYKDQRLAFREWLTYAESSGIKEFQKCAETFYRFTKEILNSFKYSHISNGPTEGFNNKIKVLKRTSYGLRNYDRFRDRILLNTI